MRQLRWLTLLLPLLVACSQQAPETPEQRVRELIAKGEAAAEARDLEFFAKAISPDYKDAQFRTRRDMLRLVTGYFLRNQSIHLLLRVDEVRPLDGDKAQAVLYAGTAGSPVDGFQQLFAMRAAVYRLEVTFQLGEEVRVLQAQWRRVDPQEVLPGL